MQLTATRTRRRTSYVSGKAVRRVLYALAGALAVVVAIILAVSWYYSDRIEEGAFRVVRDDIAYNLEVVAVEESLVTLRDPSGGDAGRRRGFFGLIWSEGYGHIDFPEEQDDGTFVWQYTPVRGTPEVGTRVHIDRSAFPDDPEAAHGIPFDEITFPAPLGDLGAWHVTGTTDTWAIYVHGRGGNRREALRTLPSIHELGYHSMVIDYRNDRGAPADPTGYFQFGATEWEDLEAAVRYALDQGARDIVLIGYSMGGGIVANFLQQSELARHVDAAVLHAPALDLGRIVDEEGRGRNLPGIVTATARLLVSLRFGVDWDALNMLDRADELATPVLLFHSDGDPTVPIRTSDEFADRRPDLVTYVRIEGTEHVGAWNVDREGYHATVQDYLRDHVAGNAANARQP